MQEITRHEPGTFCWVDLQTTDPEAAKRFYQGLFGYELDDVPMGDGAGTYTLLLKQGKQVAALSGMCGNGGPAGPPRWTSYVAVDSADATSARAKELGATVLAEPFEVYDVGRMAVIQDPTGAVFSVWQARAHIGAQAARVPGTVCWTELATNDSKRATEFYRALFGWRTEAWDGAPSDYEFIAQGEKHFGGILQMTKEWEGVPPHWMPYFLVEHCDSSVARARELGGKVCVPATDLPGTGRFSVIEDPQGARLTVFQYTGMPEQQ